MRRFPVSATTVSSLSLLCLCFGSVQRASSDTSGGADPTLGHVVRELRAELQALQRAREQDRLLLRRLEERLSLAASTTPSPSPAPTKATSEPSHHPRRHHDEEQRAFARSLRALEHERAALDTLGEQLKQMKLDLNQVVRDRERPVDADALLRADVDKLQLQVDSLRSEQSEDVSRTAARDRAQRASVDWLRRTMEELKTELAELARDTNVTAALSLSREFEREAASLRADLSELRHEAQALRATQQRQQAHEAQATGERAELRVLLQKQAVAQRDLAQQVSELTEDFRNQQAKQRKSKEKPKRHEHDDADLEFEGSGMGDNEDQPQTAYISQPLLVYSHAAAHDHRHQHGLRRLVSQLEETVQALSHDQSRLSKDVSLMRRNDTHLAALVSSMQQSADANSPFAASDINAELRSLRDQVRAQDETIRNVSNSVQSVDKVHASTVELFRDIRTLEKKVDRGLSDLRKEVSKSDFDVARALSLAKGAQRDEVARRDSLSTLKADVLRAQAELERNRYKILALENLVLNATVSGRKAGNHWVSQEVKIANLELGSTRLSKMVHRNSRKLAHLARSLDKAVNREVLDEWKRQQRDLARAVRNVTDQVPQLRNNITQLQGEMGKLEDNLPQDCSTIKGSRSGVYLIHPRNSATALKVFCDMDTEGGGWTLVQRRRDGSEDFYRTWADYRRGFGSPEAEHWLGNEALHDLTSSANYSLRVDLWDTAGRYKFVQYNRFKVASETERYRLEVYGYHGNASNALEYHSGMAFSTADRDNDFSSTHCAVYYSSGWWYNHCQYVNINGKYNVGLTWYDMDALEWVQLSRVEMKVRPARTKRKRWTRGKAT
ncbi:unnamed protein product [Ixodes hexagonus]